MTYIDVNELTVRIAEACMGNKRPARMTAKEALKDIERLNPDAAVGFTNAALAAVTFIAESCNANHPGSVEVVILPKCGESIS